MNAPRLEELLIAWEEHSLPAEELAELKHLLATEPQARRRLVEAGVFQSMAESRVETWKALKSVSPMKSADTGRQSSGFAWLTWRPLAAAAAGIVLGIFCTSVVFAYVTPSLGRVTMLLQESFESGPAPMVTGAPMEAGHWSGDYTEVVGEQQGVKPESGKKMLRFLRTDYEGKPNPEVGYVGNIYRLIDMRPYRGEFADGGGLVHFSAGFNTFEFPADERYDCTLTLFALDAESVKTGSTPGGIMLDEEPLGSHKRRLTLDRSPATWQRLTSELRLPPDTDFLLVRLSIQYSVKSASRQVFDGHYVDDLRLAMARRDPLP